MSAIPLIDIRDLNSPSEAERRRAATAIGAACREVGFFAITGHGIAPSQIAQAFALAHSLFALPLAAKQALALATHGHNRGYAGLGTESLDEHAAPDLKEAYNLIWTDEVSRVPNVWPPLPAWREAAQAYFDAVLAVGQRLHRAFALDLGMPEDHFAPLIDRPMATLRFLHYPMTFADGAGGAAPGAGVHTDYGNVTLLATDDVPGLQVRQRDGRWLDVPALPGAFVCNVGDCLMRWSNDVYLSTPHRVLPPPRERYSIAFFLDPNPDALVSALPTCVPEGEAPRHPPITAEQHLQERFAATYRHLQNP